MVVAGAGRRSVTGRTKYSTSGRSACTRANSREPQLDRMASDTPMMILPLRSALSSRNTPLNSEISGVTFSTSRVP